MQYSKAELYSYQDVGKSGHLPNSDNYGTDVLGRKVNAPIQMASPWSIRGEVQQDNPNQDQSRALPNYCSSMVLMYWFFYVTNVLGSEEHLISFGRYKPMTNVELGLTVP